MGSGEQLRVRIGQPLWYGAEVGGLQMALTSRRPPPGLILHSDRGSQYTSAAYGDMLDQHALRQSIGRPGTCWDNAVAESFFATLKKELIYPHVWPTRQSARTAIFAFIESWYNRVRLHSTLNYSSPKLVRGGLLSPQRSSLILSSESVRESGAAPVGRWRCPPGERFAEPFGLFYRLRSSAEIDWVLQRNLRFLQDYVANEPSSIDGKAADYILGLIEQQPGL